LALKGKPLHAKEKLLILHTLGILELLKKVTHSDSYGTEIMYQVLCLFTSIETETLRRSLRYFNYEPNQDIAKANNDPRQSSKAYDLIIAILEELKLYELAEALLKEKMERERLGLFKRDKKE
jgi:hypothetical protein